MKELSTYQELHLDKDKTPLNGVQVHAKEKLSLHTTIIDKSIVSINFLFKL